MATISLHVGPDAAHVRVVRLVAAAFARRAGAGEESIDEIKLAVGEACGMAVSALAADAAGHADPHIGIELDDGAGVRVVVHTPADLANQSAPDGGTGLVPDGLDVIRALLDRVEISTGPDGTVVSMSWPVDVGKVAL